MTDIHEFDEMNERCDGKCAMNECVCTYYKVHSDVLTDMLEYIGATGDLGVGDWADELQDTIMRVLDDTTNRS